MTIDFWRFVPVDLAGAEVLSGHSSLILLLASLLVACLGGVAALAVVDRMRSSPDLARRSRWGRMGTVSFGVCIWATHFTGMSAFGLHDEVRYDLALTTISLIPGFCAAGLAFHLLAAERLTQLRLQAGALSIAVGIVSMHYIGMEAMGRNGVLRYDAALFALSILVAHLLAMLALELKTMLAFGRFAPWAAPIALGLSVAGMHYTAMSAATFYSVPSLPMHDVGGQLPPSVIAGGIFLLAALLAAGTWVAARDERQLESAAQVVRETEARERALLYTVIDTIPDFIFVKDRQGRYATVNRSLLNALGVTEREEIVGHKDDDYHQKEIAERFMADDRHVMSTGEHQISREEPYVAADGSFRWMSTTKVPLRDTDGKIEGLVGIARDITDRKEVEEQLSRARQLEAMGQLAAGIAHEINTPSQYVADNTRFVQGSVQDLLSLVSLQERLLAGSETRALTAEERSELDLARSAADLDFLLGELPSSIEDSLEGLGRISSIVQSMKNFSHPDADEMQPADINGAILSTITVARSEWKYIAEVETELDPDLPQIECYLGALNQVVLNLIVNAAHSIYEVLHDTDARKLIQISTKAQGDSIEICVSDNGAGIAPEIQKRIFDPYFTTKDVGKGTGQGLALAHAVIVKKHGGSIRVESEPGKGAAFTIRLPLKPVNAMA